MDIKIYDKFNPPPKVDSPVGDVSMTDPQYARDCDINRIMKRNDLTGIPSRGEGHFIDVSEVGSFADNLRLAADARNRFDSLPAHIRARFGGDPIAFFDFCSDEANRSEMERLGLVKPVPVSPVKKDEKVPDVKDLGESHPGGTVAPPTGSPDESLA